MIRKHSYIHFLILIDILTINNQFDVEAFPSHPRRRDRLPTMSDTFGTTWTHIQLMGIHTMNTHI
jgi:hypothetical protein